MYHEKTYEELRKRRRRRVSVCVGCVLAALLAWRGYTFSKEFSREQAAATLREAVVASALHCCAVEGSYPTNVAHLEQHYGLVINENDFRVSYEWLGDNIPPSVVVRPL